MADLLSGLRPKQWTDLTVFDNDMVSLAAVREVLLNPPQDWVDDRVDLIAVHAFLAAPGGEGRNWMMLSEAEKERWRSVVMVVLRMAVDQ